MNQVMKSFGTTSVLTDPDSLDDHVEPGSDLWGLKNMSRFEEYFNSDSQKTFNEGRRGFKIRCLDMILDKSFKTSDCELVTWGNVHLNLRSLIRDTQSHTGSWLSVHLTIFLLCVERREFTFMFSRYSGGDCPGTVIDTELDRN